MTDTFRTSELRTLDQPHWVWGIAFVVVPVVLVALGVFGLEFGSFVSLSVAAAAPQVAVVLCACGLAVALSLRRRAAIAISAFGLVLSAAGLLFLHWLAK